MNIAIAEKERPRSNSKICKEQIDLFNKDTLKAVERFKFDPRTIDISKSESRKVLAVDIGGDGVRSVVYEVKDGELRKTDHERKFQSRNGSRKGKGYLGFLEEEAKFAKEQGLSVGISSAGSFEYSKLVTAANLGDFVGDLGAKYQGDFRQLFSPGLLKFASNDTIAGLIAGSMKVVENGGKKKDIVLLANGSGLGAAVLKGDSIWYGLPQHLPVVKELNPFGQDAKCHLPGNDYVCLENVAAGRAGIEISYQGKTGKEKDGKGLSDLAQQGDRLAAGLYDNAARATGHVVVGLEKAFGLKDLTVITHGGTFNAPGFSEYVEKTVVDNNGKNITFIKSGNLSENVCLEGAAIAALNPPEPVKPPKDKVDELIQRALFSKDETEREESKRTIRRLADESGIYPASIYDLYQARAEDRLGGIEFTVPAINIRMPFETARPVFKAMNDTDAGAVIFELSRMEMKKEFTNQTPDDFVTSVLAAGIKEGYRGPVFLQGDHYQFDADRYEKDPQGEMGDIKKLIGDSIKAGMYNIDIDGSTLVDLGATTLAEEQQRNFAVTAELATFIRENQPPGTTVTVGAEIGHIGDRNSTTNDLRAFMEGFMSQEGTEDAKPSKVSVATGTIHGGVPDEHGNLLPVKVDFNVLKTISELCKEYEMAGSVQHGASTLPRELFHHFPKNDTLEIHLATSLSNTIFENMPPELLKKIYGWMDENMQDKRKPEETDDQFHYNYRKWTIGQFKEEIFNMPEEIKEKIRQEIYDDTVLMFERLNVVNTRRIIDKFFSPKTV